MKKMFFDALIIVFLVLPAIVTPGHATQKQRAIPPAGAIASQNHVSAKDAYLERAKRNCHGHAVYAYERALWRARGVPLEWAISNARTFDMVENVPMELREVHEMLIKHIYNISNLPWVTPEEVFRDVEHNCLVGAAQNIPR
jgi:hypothetical protein